MVKKRLVPIATFLLAMLCITLAGPYLYNTRYPLVEACVVMPRQSSHTVAIPEEEIVVEGELLRAALPAGVDWIGEGSACMLVLDAESAIPLQVSYREQDTVVIALPQSVEELGGLTILFTRQETALILPAAAVHEQAVFVLHSAEGQFLQKYWVEKRTVTVTGMEEGWTTIQGLPQGTRVAIWQEGALEDAQRVRLE